ncbi:dTDP-glucose 4,6-dehydratase [Maricaulis maris]|uniref:dTDP-glucose 4,6-dehydratase n=1 Tax=Maricaulis maris TaxID=74318 RepID=UPI00291E1723|nr:dTDP-glucose 4,6-dehydratase [Maricaulis maris]
MKLLITGGCGFIGSAVVRLALARGHEVFNLDALTYAANPANLSGVADLPAYTFAKVDLRDAAATADAVRQARPDAVLHLAAETHVDRSIDGPLAFIETNVAGTANLLQAARAYRDSLPVQKQGDFRFVHVSTDEVYGALGAEGLFTETSAYRPNSPYAASKASSDMLVRAWGKTYDLPVLITNCSNNYGPRQFPEKLIPMVILSALRGVSIPVYGAGENVRDWLFVEDHAEALLAVLEEGRPGEVYNIGGDAECRNIDLVARLCALLDTARPATRPYAEQIAFVTDRPGHDFRYAIDAGKIQTELGWRPSTALDVGLARTVRWYLDNEAWWRPILDGRYGQERLGTRLSIPPV